MAVGFPTKGTGGTVFVNGNALPAGDLNDLGGTLNLLAPSAKGDIFIGSAANTYTKISIGNGAAGNIPQNLLPDSTQTAGARWGDDMAILTIMQAI
jgi:hypothetical protein